MPHKSRVLLSRSSVPQPHRLVPTPTGDSVTIGTERYTNDPIRMPCEQRDLLMGLRIVQPNTDTTRYRKPSAVGRIRDITRHLPFTEARSDTLG